jgi:hypothetical protein
MNKAQHIRISTANISIHKLDNRVSTNTALLNVHYVGTQDFLNLVKSSTESQNLKIDENSTNLMKYAQKHNYTSHWLIAA